MQEIWRDIPEYAGLYQVSNLGRVKSMKRVIERKNNKILPLNERILRQQNTNGYRFVRLSKNNKIKQHLVHRLVATQFIDNIFNYNEINHIDEDKTNNNVNNLEWCSHKYNINYGTGNERRRKSEKGKKKSGNYKNITHAGKKILQYDLQGNFIKEWNSIAEASKTLKLKKIWEVCNNKRNKCGNFIWKYKKED